MSTLPRAFPGGKPIEGDAYIVHGPPDKIKSYISSVGQGPSGSKLFTPTDHPYEIWYYRSIDGMSRNVTLKFVDECNCGDYRLGTDKNRDLPLMPIQVP